MQQLSDTISEVTITNDAPEFFQIGEIIVIWTVTDESGNSASKKQLIKIVDTTNPTIVVPGEIIVEATSPNANIVDIGMASAEDLVGIQTITNDAPEVFPYGNTAVIWTATDIFGNTSSEIQVITIIDTTSPSIILPPDVTSEAEKRGGMCP